MRNNIPTPSTHVYLIGVGFKKTAEILFNQAPSDFDWVYPFIANASFSIEIFLKSCLAEDQYSQFYINEADCLDTSRPFIYIKSDVDKKNKTHNLQKLFEKLSQQKKSKIVSEYQKTSLAADYPKIGNLLSDLNGLFEAARYAYSSPNILPRNISTILDTADFFEYVIPKLEGIE